MQIEETVTSNDTAAQIVRLSDYGSKRKYRIVEQKKRIRDADGRFASLDGRSQRKILLHMIGYMEASKDLISSGK